MKQSWLKIIFLFLLFFNLFGYGLASAAVTDCTSTITFGINPKAVSDSQSVTIVGTVKANNLFPYGLSNKRICYYPSSTTVAIASAGIEGYLVSIVDLNTSKEVFYFNLPFDTSNTNNSYTWTLPSRTIGASELKQAGIYSPSVNLAARVRVDNGSFNWSTLTQSSPITVSVSGSAAVPPTTPPNNTTPPANPNTPPNQPPANTTPPPGSSNAVGSSNADCENNPNSKNCLYNPLPSDSLTGTFLSIAKGFVGILAIWAVIFIIIGGFQMVMAAGNEEQYLKAKKTLIWAVLGLVVAVMSFSIVAIVQNILGASIKY